ncbi:unnamed protein product [Fraxinus pennsylvanica]|uniref:AFG1-like ATPase n=1 Tax=Fraxinus pennsylvanica TaxID=56036 RepID=A0AAD2A8E8_9LAMI|nr:unnamed protein product [Fraxinus pennsylvanica]
MDLLNLAEAALRPSNEPSAEENNEVYEGDSQLPQRVLESENLHIILEYCKRVDLSEYIRKHQGKLHEETVSHFMQPQVYSSYAPVKGLYLYGGLGAGKTMLMDLFFDQLPCNWRKKRIHLHDFMLDVHSRLQVVPHIIDGIQQ